MANCEHCPAGLRRYQTPYGTSFCVPEGSQHSKILDQLAERPSSATSHKMVDLCDHPENLAHGLGKTSTTDLKDYENPYG